MAQTAAVIGLLCSDWSDGPVCCDWSTLLWLVRWPNLLWLVYHLQRMLETKHLLPYLNLSSGGFLSASYTVIRTVTMASLFFFLYQFLVISAHMHTSNLCTTLLHHQKPELLTSPLNAYHCGCQCEWPFNQCSCLCCTLGVLTFLLIITFMFCNVLPHACSIDSLSYWQKPCSSVQTYIWASCLSISFFPSFFLFRTYPLPASASLYSLAKLVFCFLSSQCARLTQRGMKGIFYVSYSRKSPPSSPVSLCSGPVIMKVN